jgi:hypothetical protein
VGVFRQKTVSAGFRMRQSDDAFREIESASNRGGLLRWKGFSMRKPKRFYVYIMTNRPRSKKIRLIESVNPHWEDLAEGWGEVYKPNVTNDPREIPRPAGENAGLRDDASE